MHSQTYSQAEFVRPKTSASFSNERRKIRELIRSQSRAATCWSRKVCAMESNLRTCFTSGQPASREYFTLDRVLFSETPGEWVFSLKRSAGTWRINTRVQMLCV